MKTKIFFISILVLIEIFTGGLLGYTKENIKYHGWSDDGRYFVYEEDVALKSDSTYTQGVVLDVYTMKSRYFLLDFIQGYHNSKNDEILIRKFGKESIEIQKKNYHKWMKSNKVQYIAGEFSPGKKFQAGISSTYIEGLWQNNEFYFSLKEDEQVSAFPLSFECKARNEQWIISGKENFYITNDKKIQALWSPDNKRVAWIIDQTMGSGNYPGDSEELILTKNQYVGISNQVPFVIGPTKGPRIELSGDMGVFYSPVTDMIAQGVSKSGYVITSITCAEEIEDATIIYYKKTYKNDADKIAELIPGKVIAKLITGNKKNAEIIIHIGDQALLEYAKGKSFIFNIPLLENYYDLGPASFSFLGWTGDSSQFCHEYSYHGCCDDMRSQRVAIVTNLALGARAEFFLDGNNDGDAIGQGPYNYYDRGLYKQWLKTNPLFNHKGLTSPDKKLHAFGSSKDVAMSVKKGELTWEDSSEIFPRDIYFLVKDDNHIYKSNAWDAWKNQESLEPGNYYSKISVFWSPDSEKVIFAPGRSYIMGIKGFYIVPGPSRGPRLELRVNKSISNEIVEKIRYTLFKKGNFIVVRVIKDSKKRDKTILQYIKSFENSTREIQKIFPVIKQVSVMKKKKFSDIIIEIGDDLKSYNQEQVLKTGQPKPSKNSNIIILISIIMSCIIILLFVIKRLKK